MTHFGETGLQPDGGSATSAICLVERRLHLVLIDDDQELRDQLLVAADAARFRVHVAVGLPAAVSLSTRAVFDVFVCGRMSTLAALAEQAFRHQTRALVLASEPPLTGRRGLFHIRPRPADAAAMRALLLEVARAPKDDGITMAMAVRSFRPNPLNRA